MFTILLLLWMPSNHNSSLLYVDFKENIEFRQFLISVKPSGKMKVFDTFFDLLKGKTIVTFCRPMNQAPSKKRSWERRSDKGGKKHSWQCCLPCICIHSSQNLIKMSIKRYLFPLVDHSSKPPFIPIRTDIEYVQLYLFYNTIFCERHWRTVDLHISHRPEVTKIFLFH